jgi:hypothetical protein
MEIINYGEFKPFSVQKKKNKIVLMHTSREVGSYLTSLKYRYNGNYDKIPNYIITKEGKILKLLNDSGYGNFFHNQIFNKNCIFISLENLGWLEKNNDLDLNLNWIHDIYRGQPYYKNWRDYDFWDPYTKEQLESLGFLCGKICDNMKINKKFIGHNTEANVDIKYNGIITRANVLNTYTDISPAFNIKLFEKILENDK